MAPELSKTSFHQFLSESSFFRANRITESAWIQHTPFAFWLVEHANPEILVELGVHTGMSYFAFCQSITANNLLTQCYGVDTWTGDEHSGLYTEEVWLDVNGYNTREYARFSTLLRTTFNDALAYFEDRTIGLLHIDGYHTYEAVKSDFESWLPKMAHGGVVLFHDILVREREFGVYKLWAELKEQYNTFEFLHGHGLGVLALGPTPSPVLNALFDLTDEKEINKVRTAYAELGNRLSDKLKIQDLEKVVKDVSAQHQHARLQVQHAVQEHALLSEQHKNIKAQLRHAHLEYEHLKARYEQACTSLDQVKAQYDYAKIEYEQLKNEFDSAKATREQLAQNFETVHSAHEELKNSHDHLKAQYDYAKLEYEHLIARCRHLERELEQQRQQNGELAAALQAQVAGLQHALAKEKSSLEKLHAELQQQQQKVQWYRAKYDEKKLLGIIKDRLLSR